MYYKNIYENVIDMHFSFVLLNEGFPLILHRIALYSLFRCHLEDESAFQVQ